MKKILSALLAVLLLISVVPFGTVASAATRGYYTYTVSDHEATIVIVDPSISGVANIPATLGGYPVTKIGEYAFQNCTLVTGVLIPESVTYIGNNAFENCSKLASVTIPNNVTYIGESAFNKCSALTTFNFNATNCAVMGSAEHPVFSGCTSLVNIAVGSSVTKLPACAFYECTKVASISLPESLTEIGENAFYRCSALSGIEIPQNVTKIYDYTFFGCKALTNLTIPDNVLSIGNSAFAYCTALNSVTLSTNLETLGEGAFSGCTSLKNISLPSSLKNISAFLFEDCSNLQSLVIPTGVTSIGAYAFSNSGLKDISIPVSVKNIGAYAFSGCSALRNVWYSGDKTNAESIEIGLENTTADGKWRYNTCLSGSHTYLSDCDTTCETCGWFRTVGASHTVTSGSDIFCSICGEAAFLNYSFDGDNVTITGGTPSSTGEIRIPSKIHGCQVNIIAAGAFSGATNIKKVVVPHGVKIIGNYAFNNNTALTDISLPTSLVTVGKGAFAGCSSLNNVWYYGTETNKSIITFGENNDPITSATWNYNTCAFGTTHADYVTCDTVCSICNKTLSATGSHTYKEADDIICSVCGAVRYITYTVADGEVTITDCDTSASGTIEIPEYIGGYPVTTIGDSAFASCSKITKLYLPDSIIYVGDKAFDSCSGLTYNSYSSGSYIGSKKNPYNILVGAAAKNGSTFTVHNETKVVYYRAFVNYTALTSISLPDSVIFIGGEAFYGCSKLASIKTPRDVNYIGAGAFRGCSALTEIRIPNGFKQFLGYTFYGCSSLKNLTLPSTLKTVYRFDFSNCNKLTDIWYVGNETQKATIGVSNWGTSPYTNATWHFNTCKYEHRYFGDCDGTCNDCDWTRTAVSHSYSWVIDKAANCGFTGLKHEECIYCHISRNQNTVIAISGSHSYENACDADCNVCGTTRVPSAHVYDNACDTSCNVCGEVRTTSGHVYDNDCDANCNLCGTTRTPADHIYDNACDASCNVCGATRTPSDHVYDNVCDENCNVCGEVRNATHKFKWIADKPATCGENGIMHEQCSLCGEIRSENTVIPATGEHTYDNACDAECNRCGTIRVPADHVYDNDCDASCNVCGEVREITHDFEWVVDKAETCGANGTKHEECTVCGATQNENTVIPATGEHSYTNNCDADCNVCGTTRVPSDHVYDNACDTSCNVCGEIREITHDFEWVVDKAETCGVNGSKHEECTVCGATQNENTVIPATGEHSYENDCDADCNVCGSTRVPADHVYDDENDNDCNECGELKAKVLWNLAPDGTLTISGNGAMEDYTTYGDTMAPWKNSQVKKIIIGKDITRIGDFAFFSSGAKSVYFEPGSKLKEIGKGAFGYNASLTEILIPASVETIISYAFYYCSSLKTVDFEWGSNLKTIGSTVFRADTSLETVYIPSGVTSIGGSLLYEASETVEFNVLEGSYGQTYADKNNIATVVRTESLLDSGKLNGSVYWKLHEDGTIEVLGYGEMPDFTNSGDNVAPWSTYTLNKIKIGKAITKIGDFAFYRSLSKTIEFEDDSILESIGKSAFGYNSNLEGATIPKTVNSILGYAFSYSPNFKKLEFEDGSKLKTFGNAVFRGDTSLESVFIPSTVTAIGGDFIYQANSEVLFYVAEYSYSHTYVEQRSYNFELRAEYIVKDSGTVTDTVYWELYTDGTLKILGEGEIPDYQAINGATTAPWVKVKFSKVFIGKNITRIGEFAFFAKNFVSVEFETISSVKEVAKGAFGYCSKLENVLLPGSVETVEKYAFYYCSSLQKFEFEIRSQLDYIGGGAFMGDTSITSIYIPAAVPKLSSDLLYGANPDVVLLVAEGSYAHDYAIQNGFNYETRFESSLVDEGQCGENVFWEFYSDGSLIVFGDGDMYDYASSGTNVSPFAKLNVKTVTIGKGITKIGSFAFFRCKANTVEFEPGSILTEIGKAGFGYCGNVLTFEIPNSVEVINNYAFYYCTSLIRFEYQENSSLIKLGSTVFQGDTALEVVYFPETIVTLGGSLFHNANPDVLMQVANLSVAHTYAVNNGHKFELRLGAGTGGNGYTNDYVIEQ